MIKYVKYSFGFLTLALIGYGICFFVLKRNSNSESEQEAVIYTCSMHPEVRENKPGNCSICGMTLVKKITANPSEGSDGLAVYTCPMPQDSVFSDKPGVCAKCGMDLVKRVTAVQPLANHSIDKLLQPTDQFVIGNYETTVAIDSAIGNEIQLPGVIAYDPNSSAVVSARMSGRIERMYVNYRFQKVTRGQRLFDLYSPELLTEQQNFIYLLSNDAENKAIIAASKQKLGLNGMLAGQIKALMINRKANPIVSVFSPCTGIIEGTERSNTIGNTSMQGAAITERLTIKEGDYIKKGEVVFKLANTSKVWGIFNIGQGDNSLIKINQAIRISTELDENDFIDARINFIETQLNPKDKTNRVRVYLNNSTMKLPIGLRLQGIVKTNPMQAIWINQEAVVSIGTQKIVFIKEANGFRTHIIQTGFSKGKFIQVLGGISVKDKIAKKAHYLMDSESFIKTNSL